MCIRYGRAAVTRERCELIKTARAELALDASAGCPQWVSGNANNAGYYRVAYSNALRESHTQLAAAKLTASERLGLMHDANALAKTRHFALLDAFKLAAKLSTDADFAVASAAREQLDAIDPHQLSDALKPRYQRLVRKVYGAEAKRLSWRERLGESNDDHELRPKALAMMAVRGGEERFRKEALMLAKAWLSDRRAVGHDVVPAVLEVAAHFGDQVLFDAILAEARRTPDREDKRRLLNALAAFIDPKLVAAAQRLAAENTFDVREAERLYTAGMEEPATREQAWAFFKQHFDAMADKLRDDEKSQSLSAVRFFCDSTHRQDAAVFFGPRAEKFSGGPRALAAQLEGVDQCIAQRENKRAAIASFLSEF
jgi:aminopeptidase N